MGLTLGGTPEIAVRSATADDAVVVAGIFSRAFRDDPTWSVFLPRPEDRPAGLRRYYQRAVRRRPERVDVAEADGRIVGALLWTPPEEERRRRPAAAAGRLFSTAASRLRGLFSERARRGVRHARAIASFRPAEPHWYLTDIATDPGARGLGVGSALLSHRLALIDRAGDRPVYLESTTAGSRRLYSRFGFHAVGTVRTQPGQASTAMIRSAPGSG